MQVITIYISGIDMSSAFDTIYRDDLIKIAKEVLEEDEVQILSTLLAETTLEVRIDKAKATPFESNIGSPSVVHYPQSILIYGSIRSKK